jgi:hypothetical protein
MSIKERIRLYEENVKKKNIYENKLHKTNKLKLDKYSSNNIQEKSNNIQEKNNKVKEKSNNIQEKNNKVKEKSNKVIGENAIETDFDCENSIINM